MDSIFSSDSTAFMIASPPGNTGTRSGLQSRELEPVHVALFDQVGPEPVDPVRGNAAVAEAVLLHHVGDRADGAGRADRLLPVAPRKSPDDGLQLGARGKLRLLHGALAHLAVGEKAQAVGDAAHEKAFEPERAIAGADDELGGAAADVHHQPLVLRRRQLVGDAEVDEARLLAARHDLDRKLERGLRAAQEGGRVLGDPQGVGADRAHRPAVEVAQPLAKPLQARERPLLRGFVEPLVLGQPGAQPHRLAQGIQGIDLVADDPHHLAVEAVRAQIDRGEGGIFGQFAPSIRDLRLRCQKIEGFSRGSGERSERGSFNAASTPRARIPRRPCGAHPCLSPCRRRTRTCSWHGRRCARWPSPRTGSRSSAIWCGDPPS